MDEYGSRGSWIVVMWRLGNTHFMEISHIECAGASSEDIHIELVRQELLAAILF